MKSTFYFYSGILSAVYTIYASLAYYTYSGTQLITSKKAKEMIKKENVKILDVRTKVEWNIGHHPDAIHIPNGDITKKKINKYFNKKDKIIVYCNTGQRARQASEKLKSYGYENVYYIAGTYKSLL